MATRYFLIKVDMGEGRTPSDRLADYWRQMFAATLPPGEVQSADVTDLVTYNRSTPGDPWDKPYPAMYAALVERLS